MEVEGERGDREKVLGRGTGKERKCWEGMRKGGKEWGIKIGSFS